MVLGQGHMDVWSHFVIKPNTIMFDLYYSFYAKRLSNKIISHIITTVLIVYLVHYSSLSVLLSAKHHYNCNVDAKIDLFISGTILIRFFLLKRERNMTY